MSRDLPCRLTTNAAIVFVFANLYVIGVSAQSPRVIDRPRELMRVLSVAQSEYWESILPLSLSMTAHIETWDEKGRPFHIQSTNDERYSVDGMWIKQVRKLTTGQQDGREIKNEDGLLLVVNSKVGFLGRWRLNNPIAYVHEFDSRTGISDDIAKYIRRASPHSVRLCGFGTTNESFQDWVASVVDSTDVEIGAVELSDAKTGSPNGVYRFSVRPIDTDKLIEIDVDSQRCGLITRMIASEHGEVYERLDVECSEIRPGVWFPMRWTDIQSGLSIRGETGKKLLESITIVSDVVTSAKDDAAKSLTLESLNLPASCVIIRADALGYLRTMKYFKGQLVPIEMPVER